MVLCLSFMPPRLLLLVPLLGRVLAGLGTHLACDGSWDSAEPEQLTTHNSGGN
jgi:hypothetical protein